MVELNCCDIKPGLYMIDESGKIFSKHKNDYIDYWLTKDGYYRANFKLTHKRNGTFLVHKLVALTFIGEPPEDMIDPTVDHKNGITTDNRIENLRWLERKENSSLKHKSVKGTLNGRNKLSLKDVEEIVNMLISKISLRKIAKKFNISEGTVRDIKNGKIWGWYTEALFNARM